MEFPLNKFLIPGGGFSIIPRRFKRVQVIAIRKKFQGNLLVVSARFFGFSKGLSGEYPLKKLNEVTDFSQKRF